MRRYTVEVDGRAFTVDVEDAAADRFRVVVEGQAYDVALGVGEELGSASVAPTPAAAPRIVPVPMANGDASSETLGAPMPGVILRILVAAGATVQRGQDIAVLEAMKMENILRAPREGTIAEVCVRQGQQVAHGAPIVKFKA